MFRIFFSSLYFLIGVYCTYSVCRAKFYCRSINGFYLKKKKKKSDVCGTFSISLFTVYRFRFVWETKSLDVIEFFKSASSHRIVYSYDLCVNKNRIIVSYLQFVARSVLSVKFSEIRHMYI